VGGRTTPELVYIHTVQVCSVCVGTADRYGYVTNNAGDIVESVGNSDASMYPTPPHCETADRFSLRVGVCVLRYQSIYR